MSHGSTVKYWKELKTLLKEVSVYSLEKTKVKLLENEYYRALEGKAKNRSLIRKDIQLFRSIYKHTEVLESEFKKQKTWKGAYSFYKRILFIVEKDCDISKLKCKCGKKYTWTQYCRFCPDYKRNQLGKSHTEETKLKQRVSTLEYLKNLKGQLTPRYNRRSIPFIEKYGTENGYKFMHAENGGEFFIKELGYFVDAYDPIANVVLEVDERHHFDRDGNLIEKDKIREKQITKFLKCKFIRVKDDAL